MGDPDRKLTKRQQDNLRASIAKRAPSIAVRLIKHTRGELEMKPSQIKAAQILLDRVLPTVQSIDTTLHTDAPELTPEQVDQMLHDAVRDLIRREPSTVRAMLDEVPKLEVVANDV